MAKNQIWIDRASESELHDVYAALDAGEIPDPPFTGDWMDPDFRADAMWVIGRRILVHEIERRRRETGEWQPVVKQGDRAMMRDAYLAPDLIVGAPRTGVRGFAERYGLVIGMGIGVVAFIIFAVWWNTREDAPAPAPVATPVAERLPDRFTDAVNPAQCAEWWDAYWAASRSGGAASVYYPRLRAHEAQLRLVCGSAWVDSNTANLP